MKTCNVQLYAMCTSCSNLSNFVPQEFNEQWDTILFSNIIKVDVLMLFAIKILHMSYWKADIKHPPPPPRPELSGGVKSELGQLPRVLKISKPDQELMHAPLNFEKNIALAFLKVA